MLYEKLRIVSAALILGTAMLNAAPDHDSRGGHDDRAEKSGRSYEQGRTVRPQKIEREKPAAPKASHESVRPPKQTPSQSVRPPQVTHKVAPPPTATHSRPPKTVVHVDKHRPYYRPPGVRPPAYYQRPGYIVRSLPRLAIALTFGGLALYYADGIYYNHHASGYVVAVPPVGLFVNTLPVGYTIFVHSGRTYYYYADVYYVWDNYRSAYRVVNAPETVNDGVYAPGEVLETLPDGAYSVTINGIQYYRYGDTYFMQSVQGNRIVYVVVTP